jgi:hypothetical protein
MNTNADCHEINSAAYLKALNVQNALGYAGHWREYESALGKRTTRWSPADAWDNHQAFLALLWMLLPE